MKITQYRPKHYFENQKDWVTPDIPLNPSLRPGFDDTPNDARDPLEIAHWWMRPYIVTQHYWRADRNYAAFIARVSQYGSHMPIPSETEWRANQERDKEVWFKAWPSGTRYEVRCLNGGSWDRASGIGMFASLDAAIEVASKPENIVDYANMLGGMNG